MIKNEEKFFIPSKIKVGFQKRDGTYTGKLAYIIYYDNKGILRKEKSWEGWRDKSITPQEIENIPTEGFMLNRQAGGYKSDWNYRQAYCRIWDPRGFEFEITIDNLLWILDFCDCHKGKGLSGKFVYSWVGQDLVLLPECTNEYKVSSVITSKMVSKDFKASDLKPGSLYRVKQAPRDWTIGYSDLYSEQKTVFIGEVKFMKDLGSRYETKLLFYDLGSSDNKKKLQRDFVTTIPLKSIEYEVAENFLEESEIDEILHRFQLTAFSYNFWNTKEQIIDQVYTSDSVLSEFLKNNYYHNRMDKNCHVYIDELSKTIDYYKTIISYKSTGVSSYHRYGSDYIKNSDKYLSYQFSFDTGQIKISKEFVDIGKEKLKDYYSYSTRLPSINEIYPKASEDDIKKAKSLISEDKDKPKTKIYYKTTDGYYSESLQIILSNGYGKSGESLIGSGDVICLPIKKNKL